MQRAVVFVQESLEVKDRLFRLYQFRMSHDIIQMSESHLGEILANLLSQEGEIVDEVFIAADEMLAKLRILCGDPHRTGVEVTFAHHHTAKDDQGGGAETKLLSTQ